MLMVCVTAILVIAGGVPGSWALSAACSRVRTPCFKQFIMDGAQNVPTCTAASRYVACLVRVLDLAEKDGSCGLLMLNTYRLDSFRTASSYASNCPNFAIPSSLQLNSCNQQIANCGSSSLRAFVANNSNDNSKKCSELDALKTCLETQTTSCSSGQLTGLLQSAMTQFQYQATCIPSFSEQCSRVRTPCLVQKITQTQQHYPTCSVSKNYIRCLESALNLAQRTGKCEDLAVRTYQHDAFLYASNQKNNCPNIEIPSSFSLSGCLLELGTCGSHTLSAFVANNNKNDAVKCSKLQSFKTCMENNTQSCPDRQLIDGMVNKDFTYYEYQTTCVDTTTTATTTTTPPPATTTKHAASQKPSDSKSSTTTTTATTTTTTSTPSRLATTLSSASSSTQGNKGGTTSSTKAARTIRPRNDGITNCQSSFSLVISTTILASVTRLLRQ